jgi:hypothetical protein
LFQGIPVFIEGVTFDDPAVTGFSAGWMNKGEYNKNGEQEETEPFRGIVEFIQRNKNFDSDSFLAVQAASRRSVSLSCVGADK